MVLPNVRSSVVRVAKDPTERNTSAQQIVATEARHARASNLSNFRGPAVRHSSTRWRKAPDLGSRGPWEPAPPEFGPSGLRKFGSGEVAHSSAVQSPAPRQSANHELTRPRPSKVPDSATPEFRQCSRPLSNTWPPAYEPRESGGAAPGPAPEYRYSNLPNFGSSG